MKYENIEHGDPFFREKHFANKGMQIIKIEVFTPESNTCYISDIAWSKEEANASISNEDWRRCYLPKDWSKIFVFDITNNLDEFGNGECINKIQPLKIIENK